MGRQAWFWLVLGVAGAVVFWQLHPRAFPEASIDLRIRHTDALVLGAKVLRALGAPDLSRHIAAVSFSVDERAKRFLEKTMGLETADTVMRREVAVWFYDCRWTKPGDRHIYHAAISPDGRVLGAAIILPDEEPRPTVPEPQARQIAEKFLKQHLRLDLAEWRLVSVQHFQRPARRDFSFTYEHRRKRFPPDSPNPAKVRLTVIISGNAVTRYFASFLHVPEEWQFAESRRLSQHAVIAAVFAVFYALLLLTALLVAMHRWVNQKEQPVWRVGLTFGGLLALLSLVVGLNGAPLWWWDYDPAKPVGVFLTERLWSLLFFTFLFDLLRFGAWALVGERLSRDRPPANIPLRVMVRPAFLTTREAVTAIFVGIALGFVNLAYVVLFYLLGRRVGVWVPLSVPYEDTVITPLPFIDPLFDGLDPALTEELEFRLILFCWLWGWTKRWWVAALVPGAVWAFLHAGYAPEPAFIRGVELTPVGIVFAWAATRYGLLAPIVAHYTYNAVLSSLILVRAHEPFLRWSGVFAILATAWLFLPALVTYAKRRTLPTVAELALKETQPLPPAEIVAPVAYAPYQPISRRQWWVLVGLALASFLWGWKTQETFRPVALMQVNRSEARAIARAYLQRKGVPVEKFRSAVALTARLDTDEAAYLQEHAGKDFLYRFWREEQSPILWRVRFFRPLEREEWMVTITPDGRSVTFARTLPEEAPGARLPLPKARQIAEDFLRKEMGVNLREWRLVESDHHDRPKRRDWLFVYEHRHRRIADAPLRMSVAVQGDLAHAPSVWWEVPEEWLFQRDSFRAWTDLAALYALFLLVAAAVVAAVKDIQEVRRWEFNWRTGLKVGLPVALLTALFLLNNAERLMWFAYPTPVPPAVWQLIGVSLGLLAIVFGAFIAASFWGSPDTTWWRLRLPDLVPPSLWLQWRRPEDPAFAATPLRHPAAVRDAVLLGYLASGAFVWLFEDKEANALLLRSSWLPALDYLVWVAGSVVVLLPLGFGVVAYYRRFIRTPQRLFIALLLLVPLGFLGTSSPTEALREVGLWTAWLFGTAALLFWLGRCVVRHNLYAWALLIALPLLLAISVQLLRAPDPFWKLQALPLLVLYALPALAWLAFGKVRQAP